MKNLYITLIFLLSSMNFCYAFSWEDCIDKYERAKQYNDHTRLTYIYLKSTKNCLIKFKNSLIENPNPEFTIKAMNENIEKIDSYLNHLVPNYNFPKNSLEVIPKYLYTNSMPVSNKEYDYFVKFKNCNGIHAGDKIYTAKHCNVEDSTNIKYDLSYIKSNTTTNLQTSKLDLNKSGKFKYYSMSKEGMFYNILLEENNCKFYKAKNIPKGLNTTLDLTDLEKKIEIRSNCLAIPSNSGGGVFQDNKLVGIISKTVFDKNMFLYSVIEPILPVNE